MKRNLAAIRVSFSVATRDHLQLAMKYKQAMRAARGDLTAREYLLSQRPPYGSLVC